MPFKKRKVATHANAPLVHSIPAISAPTDVSQGPGHRPDHRLGSADRRAAGRDLGHAPGAADADLDRIAGRKTKAGAARRLAVDLGAGLGHAAGRARPAAVVVIPDGVTWVPGVIWAPGPGAAPVRTRRSSARGRRAPASVGRGVADHRAESCQPRSGRVRVDARDVRRPRPARFAPGRGAVAGGWAARAGARPAA